MPAAPFHKSASAAALRTTTLPEQDSAEESIPRSIVPYNRDDDRSRYLGLRASGFSIRETLGLIAKHKSTLSKWRLDPQFVVLEENIPELRKTLALEYASLEFLRNYRLILEKDFRIVKDSLQKHPKILQTPTGSITVDAGQTSQDFQYLLRMRQHYTPQQLQAIEQVMGGKGADDKAFNWTDFVLTLSRKSTTEEIKVETRHRQPAELSPLEAADDIRRDDASETSDTESQGSQS